MKDINDYMPKLPPNSWGARLNWIPKKIEIDGLIHKSPLPFDSKWHTINRVPGHKEMIIDGHIIKRSDDRKLT